MPIYEYRCNKCNKRFSLFLKISEIQDHPDCEFCKSIETSRLVSRFKTIRSEDQIMESMADPSNLSGIDENDPRSIARWAKKMAKEMGEDMGDEIEQMAEEELSKASSGGENTSESGCDSMSGCGMPPVPPPSSFGEDY
ncbi:MAG: zinc ribbon domain-containing protein [Candidatus Riflebacteria bacterium]|nr:zinc ribbon domain-containing protein [Candidatus Riflebacteria bacterium]